MKKKIEITPINKLAIGKIADFVVGLVLHSKEPKICANGNYMISLGLGDESCPEGVQVNLFSNGDERMPSLEPGDVLGAMGLMARDLYGKVQLSGKLKGMARSQMGIAVVRKGEVAFSTVPDEVSEEVRRMYGEVRGNQKSSKYLERPLGGPAQAAVVTLQDVEGMAKGEKVTVSVRIVDKLPKTKSSMRNLDVLDFTVCDYTGVSANLPYAVVQCSVFGSFVDEIDGIPPGQCVRLENFTVCRYNETSTLRSMRRGSQVVIIPEPPDMKARREISEVAMKDVVTDRRYQANMEAMCSTVTFSEKPPCTVADLLNAPPEPANFHVYAVVRAVRPDSVVDMVCPRPDALPVLFGARRLSYFFEIDIADEDRPDVIVTVAVFDQEGELFMGISPEAFTEPTGRQRAEAKLRRLREPFSKIDLCIHTYQPQFGARDSLRYQVFGTKLK